MTVLSKSQNSSFVWGSAAWSFMLQAALLLTPDLAYADECAPLIHLSGDPQLIHEVTQLLPQPTTTPPLIQACPTTLVELQASGDGIDMQILGNYQRTVSRHVSTPAVAAAIIDFWSQSSRSEEIPLASSVATQDVHSPSYLPPAPANLRWSSILSAVALPSIGMGQDKSVWFNSAVAVCAKIGTACGGFLLRQALDLNLNGQSAQLETDRSLFDFVGTGEYAFVSRKLINFWAGTGIGFSAYHIVGETSLAGNDVGVDGILVLLAPQARLDYHVSNKVSLELFTTFVYAPLAENRVSQVEGVQLPGTPKFRAELSLGVGFNR